MRSQPTHARRHISLLLGLARLIFIVAAMPCERVFADVGPTQGVRFQVDSSGTLFAVSGKSALQLESRVGRGEEFELAFLVPQRTVLHSLVLSALPLATGDSHPVSVFESPETAEKIGSTFYPPPNGFRWAAFRCVLGQALPLGASELHWEIGLTSYPDRSELEPHTFGVFRLMSVFGSDPVIDTWPIYGPDERFGMSRASRARTWSMATLGPVGLLLAMFWWRRQRVRVHPVAASHGQ